MAFPSDGDMVVALGTESPTAAQSSAFANSDERPPTRPSSHRRKIANPRRFRHEEQAYTPPIRPRSRIRSAKIVRFRYPSEESTPSASRAVTVMVDLEGQRANVMPSSEVPREIADAIRPCSRRKSAKIVRFRYPSEESTPSASRAVTVMVDLEGQRANVMPSSEIPREIADAAPDGDLGSDA